MGFMRLAFKQPAIPRIPTLCHQSHAFSKLPTRRAHSNVSPSGPTSVENLLRLGHELSKRKRAAIHVGETSPEPLSPADFTELRREAGELEKALASCHEAESTWSEFQELLSSTPELKDLASEEDLADLSSARANARLVLQTSLVSLAPSSSSSSINQAPVIIEFSQGEGGPDSALWILNLFRMYEREFVRLGWRCRKLEERTTFITGSKAGAWGYSKLVIEVWNPAAERDSPFEEGAMLDADTAYVRWKGGVFGRFKWETGVHRLQKISDADKAGRIMTSAAVVYVIPTGPLTEGNKEDESVLDLKDVRIDVMRSSGAGGQHVNTTDSAVRLVHLPTGTTVSMQDSRSQHENKSKAFKILESRLLDAARQERQAKIQRQRKGQIKGTGKGDRIRTYNFQQSRVTDHRIHLSISLNDVEDGSGGFEVLHEALEANEIEGKIEEVEELLEDG